MDCHFNLNEIDESELFVEFCHAIFVKLRAG